MLARVEAQWLNRGQQQDTHDVVDGVMAVIDIFKSAALLARARDLQAEAQALSRLGHTYKVGREGLHRVERRVF